MKITSTRIATAADAKAIAELANEHELSVDIKSSLFSEQGALDFIKGYIDPSVAYLVGFDDELGFSAIVNLHPDSASGRCYTDIYARPHVENLENVALWATELAELEHPGWDIRPGINSLDQRLQSAWTKQGFEFLRRYYTMRMKITSAPSVRKIDGLEIRAIDITNPDQVALWHSAHQDSFSTHFGFTPRGLDKWRELVLDSATDPNGVFLAFKNGEAVGFCQCNDEYFEENRGFINLLGVTQENQSTGIGEALLQTGITHCLTKGYDSVELNVDTGNESGALKLYEKVGFKPESSWVQMNRPR
jgi:ribosomal protein S18 acetylase RimI-like enzyme